MKRKTEDEHASGHLKVTWSQCPNKKCPSRHFSYWDVDFTNDKFWCGTCEIDLRVPCFLKANVVEDDD